LDADGREVLIDSRPSDAIALAVRTKTPIYVSAQILNANGIEFEREVQDVEEIVSEFRQFLDDVSPEDF
jgi:hypothetical protein